MILSEQSLRAWLQLLNSGIEYTRITNLLREASGPEEVFDFGDETLRSRFALTDRQVELLRKQTPESTIKNQILAMEKHQIRLLPISDADFPGNLFKMRTPPPAIFVKGRIETFDSLAVGIVGPRKATPYGLEVTRSFARDFASTMTVVSGAALGIDSEAHDTVLNSGGRTLAVLGCGIDVDYPSANRRLRERIASGESGALVSLFPPGSQPLRHHFPIRNYILAGLSLAVVIAEASETSGALVTARAAAEEGRSVYAVPGDITRNNSRGSNMLIRDGAILCTSAADVIADMEQTLKHELLAVQQRRSAAGNSPNESMEPRQREEPLGGIERILYDEISHHPVSHDDLMDRYVPARMSVGELSSALLMLELNGRIRTEPGRIYAPALR